jgi:hypothetical protein
MENTSSGDREVVGGRRKGVGGSSKLVKEDFCLS